MANHSSSYSFVCAILDSHRHRAFLFCIYEDLMPHLFSVNYWTAHCADPSSFQSVEQAALACKVLGSSSIPRLHLTFPLLSFAVRPSLPLSAKSHHFSLSWWIMASGLLLGTTVDQNIIFAHLFWPESAASSLLPPSPALVQRKLAWFFPACTFRHLTPFSCLLTAPFNLPSVSNTSSRVWALIKLLFVVWFLPLKAHLFRVSV